MNLDRIQLFLEIVDQGSLSSAARAVHLSQPAASRNLAALEEELGTRLFERVGRGLELNAAGRAFLSRARAVVREVEGLRRSVEEVVERGVYDVSIGTVDSLGTFVLPPAVSRLVDHFPDVAVKVRTMRTADLLDRLGQDIDLAVVAWSGEPEGWQSTFIAPYDMRFYGRRDRFPDLASVTEEAELQDYPLVQIEPRPGQPTLVSDEMPSFALTQSLASVKALIMQGFGVGALLNYMLGADELAQLAVASVPHDPDCGLYMIRSDRWAGDEQERIADSLAAEVASVLNAREPS